MSPAIINKTLYLQEFNWPFLITAAYVSDPKIASDEIISAAVLSRIVDLNFNDLQSLRCKFIADENYVGR
jgi:hypothetical protein